MAETLRRIDRSADELYDLLGRELVDAGLVPAADDPVARRTATEGWVADQRTALRDLLARRDGVGQEPDMVLSAADTIDVMVSIYGEQPAAYSLGVLFVKYLLDEESLGR